MTIPASAGRSKVFVSYSHQDQRFLHALQEHLKVFQQRGLLDLWVDTQLVPGDLWLDEIRQGLAEAKVAILLVSASFLTSKFVTAEEISPLLLAAEKEGLKILPVIVRPCAYLETELAAFQSVNSPQHPASGLNPTRREQLWMQVAQLAQAALDAGVSERTFHTPDLTGTRLRDHGPTVPSPLLRSAYSLRNRQRMLATVRAIWITGVLSHSVHDAAMIALGLEEQPAAVAHPWRLAIQAAGHLARALPVGTTITRAFDDAGGKLLILGAPGAGKTTLLLELARDLLERAERDDTLPIPVIFSLSSWANRQANIPDWFVEELNLKYGVPEKVGRAWVQDEQLLPLLDGLDEVPEGQRSACVAAINAYQQLQGYGLAPLALTSRDEAYQAVSPRVFLHTAVIVQPLTPAQIDAYLSSARGGLEGVRIALNDNPDLQALATSPLMLSILSLAYQGQSVDDLLETPPAARQRHLFRVYVRHMLERRKVSSRYSPDQTKRWLSWLAQQMIRHHQTEFYLEQIQPDWLQGRRWLYGALVSLFIGLSVWLGVGLGVGLGIGLFHIPQIGVVGALANGIGGGLLHIVPARLMDWLAIGLGIGFLFGLVGSFMGWIVYGRSQTIKPAEILVWSLGNIRKHVTRPLIGALFFGLLFGLNFGLVHGLFGALVGGFVGGIIGWLVGVLVNGWASELLESPHRVKPNQGIWRSARYSLLVGLGGVLAGSFTFGLGTGLGDQLSDNWHLQDILGGVLAGALLFGLGIGLLAGLVNGGGACVQHLVLRVLLWRTGGFPWRYVSFLDYAASCILLRKVGGGYSFIHRLLLDYFAEPEPAPISSSGTESMES